MHGIDSIHTEPLRDGLPGTKQTLEHMAAYVRKDAGNLAVRQKALEIVQECGGHEFDCEIQALFHYCRNNITYRRDPIEVEWIADTPRTLFVFGVGDCDEKSVCLATLLATLGHKSRFVVVGHTPDKYVHVFIETLTKHGWVSLDPTPEQAPLGWQARGMHRAVYEIWPVATSNGLPIALLVTGLIWWWLR